MPREVFRMRWTWGAALVAVGVCNVAAAGDDWTLLHRTADAEISYMVGAVRAMPAAGLSIVEYKLLAVNLEDNAQGLHAVGQFVAACDPASKATRMVMEHQRTVMRSEAGEMRVVGSQQFKPVRAVPLEPVSPPVEIAAVLCKNALF